MKQCRHFLLVLFNWHRASSNIMSLCPQSTFDIVITSEHTNIGNLLHHPGHGPHLLALLGGVLAAGRVRGQVAERVPAAARVVEVGLDLREHHHDVVPGRQGDEARLPDRVTKFCYQYFRKNATTAFGSPTLRILADLTYPSPIHSLVWVQPCRCRCRWHCTDPPTQLARGN